MTFQQQFKMQCSKGHKWVETYPTGHTQFGDCPKCPGRTKGRVLVMADVQEVETHITEGVFVHQCISPGCGTLVEYDDEPCCFKHSPDSGSSLPFYSARQRLTEGITPP